MTAQHEDRAHAKLSPSAASRWMSCPGSIRLSEGAVDVPSRFAAEGTAAHQLAETCLRDGTDAIKRLGETIAANGFDFIVDGEMVDGVQLHIDYVRAQIEPGDEVEYESRIDLTHVHPEMFGTGDVVIYKPEKHHLLVTDFKYGRGVAVDPAENKQLLTYAVGAIRRHHNRPLDKVTLAVIQPRAAGAKGGVKTWETDPLTLIEFELALREAAAATGAPDAPVNPGEWCKFCKAAPVCPALREKALSVARMQFGEAPPEPESMSREELGRVLDQVQIVENWCRRVQEFGHAQATAGEPPTGWKLVAKRAYRKWADPDTIVDRLRDEAFLSDNEIFQEPEARSVAQLEKVLGKKRFAEVEERLTGDEPLIVKQSSGTVLAPLDDKREAVKPDAARQFEAVE